MADRIGLIKRKLDAAISQLCEVSWMFSKSPGRDFSRNRKLSFRKVITFLLSMEGGSLMTEMIKHFGSSADIASTSAFVQQRNKLNSNALPSFFDLFVRKTDSNRLYKGLRLIAADESDIQIPTNPCDKDSYFPSTNGQSSYKMLHLDAMYDLLKHTYTDASLAGQRKVNERNSLCAMVDRFPLENVLLIADRGYEGHNLMAHIQEKRWHFLIHIQDVLCSRGIASGLNLPDKEEFDMPMTLTLTTKAYTQSRSARFL